jgi:ABC-type phosphate transport system substrate-binding protein
MRTLLSVAAVLALATSAAPLRAQANSFRIVVNAANPVSSLTRTEASRLFLKKVTSWRDGKPVLVVDQPEVSPCRRSFTKEIHGREVSSVKSYWQQMIFAGRAVPPPEKPSDSDVVSFVATNPSAIGYVSPNTAVGEGVKVVTLTDQ